MPAHLRDLPRCQSSGCDRPATIQLFNTWNAPLYVYCDRHGKSALKAFEERNPDQAAAR